MIEKQTYPLGLYKKMQAIMSEATHLDKDKMNVHFKYKYASEQAIKELFHPLLVKNGILFIPTAVEILSQSPVETKSEKKAEAGKASNEESSSRGDGLTRIRYHYRFIDVDDGGFIEGFFDANGHDTLDKGCYKAMTGAIKYILTGTFLLPTGDDPEKDTPAERRNNGADSQVTPREDQYVRLDRVLALAEEQGKITTAQRIALRAKAANMKTADEVESAIEKVGSMVQIPDEPNTQGE